MKLEVDYPLLAMKWAWFALRAQDYEWAEREIKQAIRMMEGGNEGQHGAGTSDPKQREIAGPTG